MTARRAVAWMLDRARTGLCAIQLGVTEEAVRRAASYLNQRHQFGRPLSSFQGTMLRAADAYIDTEAIRVTTWQAAWRIDEGLPAAEAVAVAHWWASEAGQRVVHATQHLHGGLGADISYPIHRYFLWGKQIELMLQGPSAELSRLGSLLATRLARRVGRRGARTMSPVRADTLRFEEISVGDALPELAIALTRTLIVATAIASRDYQDVHHDPGLAVERGSPDIFMNILTTNGFVGRFVTDWAGPGARIESVSIRLGAPNYPGDTMTLTGAVTATEVPPQRQDGRGVVEVTVRGANSRGDHVTGTVRLSVSRDGRGHLMRSVS